MIDIIPKDYELPLYLFHNGTNCETYKFLGCHKGEKDGIEGYYFRVWAAHAEGISVVGDFNDWDENATPMEKIDDSEVWEAFVTGLQTYDTYKYCIHGCDGKTHYKADPYGTHMEVAPSTGSKVFDIDDYLWSDKKWMTEKKSKDIYNCPMNIYEVHLNSWKACPDGKYFSYVRFADTIIPYIKEMGYTHIELMPLAEYPFDGSWGYQGIGYFAPTSRFGTPYDFMKMIDLFHLAGIGVILDWVPAHFPRDEAGLFEFDGGPSYEYSDPKKADHLTWGTRVFDYSKGEVKSFLISNALYWIEKYHVDGLRVDAVASMLYLDYGRKPGEWIPNVYGGKENINAVEFIQNVRKMVDSLQKNTILAAEESSGWQFVTGDIADGGLGFDYKWNDGWKKELVPFIEMDPLFRKGIYGRLTYSMLYQYSDDFIIGFSRNGYGWKKGILKDIVPDNGEDVLNHVKTALGYMYFHPGKKLINIKECSGVEKFVAQMNNLYRNTKALYECDDNPSGFEWADDISAEETVIAVLRRDESGQSVIGAVNFTPVERKEFCIGVDEAGKYTDVLNDSVVYESSEHNWNSKDESVFVDLKPLGISLYTYEPYTEIEKERIKIEKETKEALMLAKKEADEAKAVKDAAIERAKQAKEAEIIALAAAKEAEKAEKEAAKKAEEARIACIKIDENAKKKLAELKKMEEKQGE